MVGEKVLVSEKSNCQFCSNEAKYDGRTKMGPWAYMCEDCFQKLGVGLGTGKGQELVVVEKQVFISDEDRAMQANTKIRPEPRVITDDGRRTRC